MDWGIFLGLLIGLLAIAVAIFFGLSDIRKNTSDKLSAINEKLIEISTVVDKAWDLLSHRAFQATVERKLTNLGRIKISAEPSVTTTNYIIEIENPILQQELLQKLTNEKTYVDKEREIFRKSVQTAGTVYSPTRARLVVPCTDAKLCTEYVTFFLKWLDSEYFAALPTIKDFEESILT